MVPDLFCSQLVVLIALAWLCLMLQGTWPRDHATWPWPLTPAPKPSVPTRHRELKPLAGLTTTPH
jgi:hypothetical protein